MTRARTVAVVLALALGTVACSSGPAATASETRVTNTTDLFQFSVLSLAGDDDGRSYEWRNNGTRAQVDVASAITSGDALLTIRDADGTVLYQEDILDDVDLLTEAGTPGLWSVEVDFAQTYGSFSFTLTRQD